MANGLSDVPDNVVVNSCTCPNGGAQGHVATCPQASDADRLRMDVWGGGLRKDWPPEEGSIITCPSCEMRHGRRYMCDARMRLIEREERR